MRRVSLWVMSSDVLSSVVTTCISMTCVNITATVVMTNTVQPWTRTSWRWTGSRRPSWRRCWRRRWPRSRTRRRSASPRPFETSASSSSSYATAGASERSSRWGGSVGLPEQEQGTGAGRSCSRVGLCRTQSDLKEILRYYSYINYIDIIVHQKMKLQYVRPDLLKVF